jgi:2-phosphoglycerate kinase
MPSHLECPTTSICHPDGGGISRFVAGHVSVRSLLRRDDGLGLGGLRLGSRSSQAHEIRCSLNYTVVMVDRQHGAVASGWQILLIGGSSGTGKTVLAHHLARQFGVGLTQVDDLRLALQRMTTSDRCPALHYFLSTPIVWNRPPTELRDGLIKVGRVISQALEPIIQHHLDTPYPLILEGDGILPELIDRLTLARIDTSKVRAMFLFEPDEAGLRTNMAERGRGFEYDATPDQHAQVQMNWLYGHWLREEATRLRLPVLSTRPRATLVDRAMRATDGA